MQENNAVQRNREPDIINIRRNPYLADYEEQRRRTAQSRRTASRTAAQATRRTEGMRQARRPDGAQQARRPDGVQQARRPDGVQQVRRPDGLQQARRPDRVQQARRPDGLQQVRRPDSRQLSREAVKARRRRKMRRQRIAVGIWAVCIIGICIALLWRQHGVSAAGSNGGTLQDAQSPGEPASASTALIQGLPVEKFTAHPEWTEDFLTPNEYSRPGEALPEVKDIFVHYTANPKTSAAQNRSYFERQKDEHKVSASAHFIIGYEGEIIQCVPLDEIAYAVVGRNYDSVSIECCHIAKDGSFTEETYDSLIALLAWLTDVYDLDTDHILRHYDCGGKKCPLYYTEHEDQWEQLKEDVAAF